MNFNDIQDPETRIQDQSILSMVFIAAAKLDFKILCNYRVNDKLQENIAFAQGEYDFLINAIEGWISESGNDYPLPVAETEWEPHQPLLEYNAPTTPNLKENNITAVLWATGWNADLSWLQIDSVRQELGPHGRPEACDTSVPGFFRLGFHWLRFFNSGNGAGFHYDAPYIGSKLR